MFKYLPKLPWSAKTSLCKKDGLQEEGRIFVNSFESKLLTLLAQMRL